MNHERDIAATGALASRAPHPRTPGVYRFGWASLRVGAVGLVVAMVLVALWAFDVVGMKKVQIASGRAVAGAKGNEIPTVASPPDAPATAPARMVFASSPPPADEPALAPSDQAGIAQPETKPADAVPEVAAAKAPDPVVPDPRPADNTTDAVVEPTFQEAAASEPGLVYQGSQVDGEALAELRIAGKDDRKTLESWLAAGVVTLTIETPKGTVVAMVPPESTAGEPVYQRLSFMRPEIWKNGTAVDPRSNIRIRHKATPPLRMATLELYLSQAIGIARIDSVSVNFTNRAAAEIRTLQTGVLSRLNRENASALRLFLCFVDGQPRLERAEDRETDKVLESPGECRRSGQAF